MFLYAALHRLMVLLNVFHCMDVLHSAVQLYYHLHCVQGPVAKKVKETLENCTDQHLTTYRRRYTIQQYFII